METILSGFLFLCIVLAAYVLGWWMRGRFDQAVLRVERDACHDAACSTEERHGINRAFDRMHRALEYPVASLRE